MTGDRARLASPVLELQEKFKRWLLVQPEWLHIVNMPRPERRAAMKELANQLYTIPIMDGVNTVPRQVRRKAAKQLAHVARTEQASELVTEAIEKALRDEAAKAEALAAAAQDAVLDEVVPDFEGTEPVVGEMVDPGPLPDPLD